MKKYSFRTKKSSMSSKSSTPSLAPTIESYPAIPSIPSTASEMSVELDGSLASHFLSGLHLAYDFFEMSSLEVRLQDYKPNNSFIRERSENLKGEFEAVRAAVDRQANFRIASLIEESNKLLATIGQASQMNALILSYFVSALGSHITALTFRGKRRPRETFSFGLTTLRGFMAGTQTPERIYQTLNRLLEVSEMNGGRVVTGAVTTEVDMRATAVAVAAFYKIARLFGVKTCPLTDRAVEPTENILSIRFEGRFNILKYEGMSTTRADRQGIIRQSRRNVYILGPNGVGKSSWANLLSSDDTFEVGVSDHTTMIPQACDIDGGSAFRLWDTPGLFDGTEEQRLMEEYMNHIIDMNGYCSGVLFVFNGSIPANESIGRILQFAINKFGDHVKTNFVAIVNNFYNQAPKYKPTYSEIMHHMGFKEDGTNVIISSPIDSPTNDVTMVRMMLEKFKPRLVARHFKAYKDFLDAHGNLTQAVRALYIHGRQELEGILRRGKIETVRYMANGPKKNLGVRKDVLYFRQHSKSYLFRRFGVGRDKVLEERSVLLRGSAYFMNLIRAQLNQEYTVGEANIFIRHILGNERYILIHTPKGECDYELRDATAMSDVELQELLSKHLIEEVTQPPEDNVADPDA